ncbi:hypothetical protein J7E50_18060 [Pedobacter sp. ISL-68]|uniref:hypothetical protein n=1 Tax=unclassified Pedobacter TaxID=2628915 RepID=UPI001BEBFD49|nr:MULTISPECIES: hypothetical protein [unclassified Pedobacter]MBT2559829.1 hypothetical protein [Pedobacter sp. ISL-64]MBT2592134.1 hypothetical protein [Pedobacter sp. ISL-68]
MRSIVIALLIFLSTGMFGQENVNSQLKKLFLDLEINLPPKLMVGYSSLTFEWSIRKGISWDKDKPDSEDTHIFNTRLSENPFITGPIKEGQISLIQTNKEMEQGRYSIHQKVVFYNADDMINEYNNSTSLFEKFGYKIKTSTIQNENFETKFELTEILMENESKKCKLTISYSVPAKKEKVKEYSLVFVFTNIEPE